MDNRLIDWLLEALESLGGKGSIVEICEFIWKNHKKELENSTDLFYKWQYRIRWAAHYLRKQGKMKPYNISSKGIWELS